MNRKHPLYRFERLVRKYSNKMTIEIASEKGTYDMETGEYIKGETSIIEFEGAILPLKARAIYESGGRLTSADRLLYSLTPFKEKQQVIYKNKVYSVESEEEYIDYADFYHYTLKAVSSFYVKTE